MEVVMTHPDSGAQGSWTFLTNHAHALICIAQDTNIRIQDIADRVGITLRAAQGIVRDLADAGYVTRARIGRRNHYDVHPTMPLRHPIERHHFVGELLSALASAGGGELPEGPRSRRPGWDSSLELPVAGPPGAEGRDA
jgi:MarR family